jgi:hypothetical protein
LPSGRRLESTVIIDDVQQFLHLSAETSNQISPALRCTYPPTEMPAAKSILPSRVETDTQRGPFCHPLGDKITCVFAAGRDRFSAI